ncbi:MAG: VanZ protein [Acidobacteria bacterium]|nr:VanZ protein [Acidobacteriota bacterium]
MAVPRHSTRRAWLLVALTIAYPLLHKDVSDVFDWASARWGFSAYNRAALIAIPLISILAMAPALARRRDLLLRTPTVAGVLVLTASTWAAQRWLMVVNIELIHLPQIALIAAVALSLGLSGPAAYLTATAAGALDETYQHLVVYAGRSDTYFDVNDIVINAIGAAWAVVLLAGTGRLVARSPPIQPSCAARRHRQVVPSVVRGRRGVCVRTIVGDGDGSHRANTGPPGCSSRESPLWFHMVDRFAHDRVPRGLCERASGWCRGTTAAPGAADRFVVVYHHVLVRTAAG